MSAGNIRLGVIGFGAQGGVYAGFVASGQVEGMGLGAICDIDPTARERAGEKHPDVPVFADYLVMLDSGVVDAVVTTVTHYLHPEMTTTAIGKCIRTLTVQPVGVDSKDVQQINSLSPL